MTCFQSHQVVALVKRFMTLTIVVRFFSLDPRLSIRMDRKMDRMYRRAFTRFILRIYNLVTVYLVVNKEITVFSSELEYWYNEETRSIGCSKSDSMRSFVLDRYKSATISSTTSDTIDCTTSA